MAERQADAVGGDPVVIFRELLARRAEATPAQRQRLDAEIAARYQRPRAVMITDLSGFTRITRSAGILHFLTLAEGLRRRCEPILARHGGFLVKTVGDDLYVTFADPAAALQAGAEMIEASEAQCARETEADRLRLSVGIAWGPILDIDGVEFFGDAVNVASKLGEDLAGPGELLVSAELAAATPAPIGWRYEPREEIVSRVRLSYCAVRPA